MRLRNAFIVWGLLAIVGWTAVLLPAYVLIDHGPQVVHAFFGEPEPAGVGGVTAEEIEALARIAPAAGRPGK